MNPEFKVTLSYTASLRPSWTTFGLISKEKKNNQVVASMWKFTTCEFYLGSEAEWY